jgi:hypothetical protein
VKARAWRGGIRLFGEWAVLSVPSMIDLRTRGRWWDKRGRRGFDAGVLRKTLVGSYRIGAKFSGIFVPGSD